MESDSRMPSDFSVLSQPSDSSSTVITNGFLPSNLPDLQFALSGASFDLNYEQLQDLIQNLLSENAKLKDVVHRDHMTMKSQYEIILKSKEQIDIFMKQQLERREQAKFTIQHLREENAELKLQLQAKKGVSDDSSMGKSKLLTVEIQEWRAKYEQLEQEKEHSAHLYHQLEAEVLELRKDYSQLKISHDHLLAEKKALVAVNFELQSNLEASRRTPGDASSEGGSENDFLLVSADGIENVDKKKENALMQRLTTELNVEKQNSELLAKQLEAEKLKAAEQRKQIEGQEEVIRRLAASQQQPGLEQNDPCLNASFKTSEQDFSKAKEYMQTYKERCDSLEKWLSVYQGKLESLQMKDGSVINQLKCEVENLRKALEAEQARSNEDKKNLMETEHKFGTLMKQHQELQQSWEDLSKEQARKDRQSEAYYSWQLKSSQEKVDAMVAKLVECEEKMNEKDKELAKTKDMLQRLQREVEAVPILQTQVEVYKADFKAERESREKIHQEKETLLEELRSLQNALQAQGRSDGSNSRRHRRHSRSSPTTPTRGNVEFCIVNSPTAPPSTSVLHSVAQAAAAQEPHAEVGGIASGVSAMNLRAPDVVEEPTFTCPKCNLAFTSYQPLLNHVNNCLDNDSYM